MLLAADGAGKSTVMGHLQLAEPMSTDVDLPALDKAGILAAAASIAVGIPVDLRDTATGLSAQHPAAPPSSAMQPGSTPDDSGNS